MLSSLMNEFIVWIIDLAWIIGLAWTVGLTWIVGLALNKSLNYSSLIAVASCFISLASVLIAKSNVNLTYDLVAETRKMREAQTEPFVYPYIKPQDKLNEIMDMFIENIGSGLASDIEFYEVSDFRYAEDKSIRDVSLIKDGVRNLAPDHKLQVCSVQSHEIFKFNPKDIDQINMRIKYKSRLNIDYDYSFQINISTLRNVQRLGKHDNFPLLVETAKKIEADIKDISRSVEELTSYSIQNLEENDKQL